MKTLALSIGLVVVSVVGFGQQLFRPVGRLESVVTIRGTAVAWVSGDKFVPVTDGHWRDSHYSVLQYAGKDWAVDSIVSEAGIVLASTVEARALVQTVPERVVVLTFEKRH